MRQCGFAPVRRPGARASDGKRQVAAGLALSAVLAAPLTSWAEGFDAERFQPAAGAAGGFMVERPIVPLHLGFGFGLMMNYALNSVVLRDEGNDQIVSRPLQHSFSFDLLASVGLFDFLEIAADLPIHALYTGDDTSVGGETFSASGGVGDLRLVPKAAWWLGGWPAINFYIGGVMPITLPTGDPESLRGAGGVTIEPRLLAGAGSARWLVAVSLGFRSRLTENAVDHTGRFELTYGIAGTYEVLTGKVPLDLQLELNGAGRFGAAQPGAPLELLGGVIVWPHPEWSIYASLGPGLTDGVGAPDLRAVVGVRFAHRVPGLDRYSDSDDDGIPDYRDDCRDEPEDADGFEDDDGCPEPDNDSDGILDVRDECPTQAEEPGGDGDGCPDKGHVIIKRGKVYIFGKVQFDTGKATIKAKSNSLLDQIATEMNKHPEIAHLRIEGHTDARGPESVNQRLSQQRAESVKRALVERGVDDDRLSTVGRGESQPLAPNSTAAGRARNRRVEFIATKGKSGD